MKKHIVFYLLGSALMLGSCEEEQVKPSPGVDTVAPMSVPVGATVVLTGTNFSSTPAANRVTFNGVPGVVLAATPTQLTVTVPAGAFTSELLSAEVYVVTEGRSSASPSVLLSDRYPQFLSIEPSSGPVGTVITIRGRNFNADIAAHSVLFTENTSGPPRRTPLTASPTVIQVAVPAGTSTGDVCLMTYLTSDRSKYLSDCKLFTITP